MPIHWYLFIYWIHPPYTIRHWNFDRRRVKYLYLNDTYSPMPLDVWLRMTLVRDSEDYPISSEHRDVCWYLQDGDCYEFLRRGNSLLFRLNPIISFRRRRLVCFFRNHSGFRAHYWDVIVLVTVIMALYRIVFSLTKFGIRRCQTPRTPLPIFNRFQARFTRHVRR